MVQYAEYCGLEIDITDLFIQVIRALDKVYLEWCSDAASKINKINEGKANARFPNQS